MVLLPSKYMCSAVASHCHFTIDLTQCSVTVQSYFQISIPLLNQRWNIGQIQLSIKFYCPTSTSHHELPIQAPRVEFHVEDYKPLIDVEAETLDDHTNELNESVVATVSNPSTMNKKIFNEHDANDGKRCKDWVCMMRRQT